jgi:DNA-binding LytR/AlgR family response regulator
MKSIRILIVEDDISFATGVQMDLESLGFNQISVARDVDSALSKANSFKPDLALVDINLGSRRDDTSVSSFLNQNSIPFIIMTNMRDEVIFAKISKLSPLAYFTKPIDVQALKYTITSYFGFKEEDKKQEELVVNKKEDFFFIKKANKFIKINFEEINYINADGNYVLFHLDNVKYIIRKSLSNTMETLPDDTFIRVHRAYAVNKYNIQEYDKLKSILKVRDIEIPVGRSFRGSLKSLIL